MTNDPQGPAPPAQERARRPLVGRAAAAVAARPRVGGGLLALLVVLAVLGFLRPVPEARLDSEAIWQDARRTSEQFGLDAEAGLLALAGDARIGPELEETLLAVERAVEGLPAVSQLITPADLGRQPDGGVDPLAIGRLVHPGDGVLAPIVLRKDADAQDWRSAVEEAARGALADAPVALDASVTGVRAIIDAQTTAFSAERLRFTLFGAFLGFALASLVFRSAYATLLAGLPPLVGLFLAVGIARLLGLGADGFTKIVLPLLILTIGFTDGLHVVIEAARARADGRASSGAAAGVEAVRTLGWPCALTSLTTAIGFSSMALSGNALVFDFGLSCALGTALSFVAVVLLVPLLARTRLSGSLERVGRARAAGEASSGASGEASGGARPRALPRPVDAALTRMLKRPILWAAVGAALTVFLTAAFLTMDADRRTIVDLADDSEAAAVLLDVDERFGGVFPLSVRLDWDAGVDYEEVVETSRAVSAALVDDPLFAAPVGPAEQSDYVGRLGPLGLGTLSLLESPLLSRSLVDEAGRSALVRTRVPDAGSATLVAAFDRLRARLDAIDAPGVRAELVGEHVAYLTSVDAVTRDLGRSLGVAAVLILATLALAFRSLRLGLASVVPNLLPLGAVGAGVMNPFQIVPGPDGDYLYVGENDASADGIAVLDAQTLARVGTVSLT
ncbi:MAG: MMPL family transporter, partial [Planctomycetota bacterium]